MSSVLNLSLEQKAALIQRHPCFSQLNNSDALALAQGCVDKTYKDGEALVSQGELVDSIYFIASGCAQVQYTALEGETATVKTVALLNEGEAIGLNEAGFYSATGSRTASVVATTAMVVLYLDVKLLSEFLTTRPYLNPNLTDNANLLWQMRLIKQATPFGKLSIDGVRELARHVEAKRWEQGAQIFIKGDPGDSCYLIKSGAVEIYMPQDDGSTVQIAQLVAPMVFGEAAVLLSLPRNASARTVEDCELLSLTRDALMAVVKSEKKAENSLMSLVRLRARPLRVASIEIQTQTTPEQATIITLRNPTKNTYYRLQEEGLFIWNLLDGQNTLRDLTVAFHKEYDHFDPSMISDFIVELEAGNFIENMSGEDIDALRQLTFVERVTRAIKAVMEAKVTLRNVDGWMTRSYDKFARYLFTKPILYTMALTIVVGFIAFIARFGAHKELFRTTHNTGWLLVAASSAAMFTIIFHELAHGYATKHAGKKVIGFGVGWFWVGPIAFCDTTDMWLANKRQRLAVDLAGIFLNALVGGIAALCAFFVTTPDWAIFWWLFALNNYFAVFYNLDPVLEFDGYYTLLDFLDTNKLREKAALWLITDFKKCLKTPALFRKNKIEVTYWCMCLVFISCSVAVKYVLVNIILAGVFGGGGHYWSYLITLFAVAMSLLSVWGTIKKKIANMKREA